MVGGCKQCKDITSKNERTLTFHFNGKCINWMKNVSRIMGLLIEKTNDDLLACHPLHIFFIFSYSFYLSLYIVFLWLCKWKIARAFLPNEDRCVPLTQWHWKPISLKRAMFFFFVYHLKSFIHTVNDKISVYDEQTMNVIESIEMQASATSYLHEQFKELNRNTFWGKEKPKKKKKKEPEEKCFKNERRDDDQPC